jgi:hypothetical protein
MRGSRRCRDAVSHDRAPVCLDERVKEIKG